jgi:drug/metabolite transporter (DMT)-like permease
MTYLALSLVLAAACCHATWNLLVKRLNAGPELVWLFSLIAVPIYLPLAIGSLMIQKPVLGWYELAFCLGSALLHMGYFLLLQQGYRHGDLSLVYPTARATGPFLSATFAVLVLGEHITPQIMIGGLAIIVGVLFLTGGFRARAHHATRSLVFGVMVGMVIGSYTVWDAYTVRTLLVPPLILEFSSILARLTLLSPYAVTRKTQVGALWRDHRWSVIGIAVFNPLAYILVLIALSFTPVVYVAPARELSVLLSVVLGAWILKEGDFGKRFFWAILILAGMVLLATG